MDRSKFEELKHCGDLPSPSSAGMRILVLTQDEDYSMDEIIPVIQSDPALTGRLIQLATSSQHAGQVKVTSVKDAAVRLGTKNVTCIAMGFSLIEGSREGRCKGFDYAIFWSRSLATAVAAQGISSGFNIGSPVDSFTLGLLSGIGKLALANVHPEGYAEILETLKASPKLDVAELESERFYINHREVGAALLAEWGLPDSFCEAIMYFDGKDYGADLEDQKVKEHLRVLNGAAVMSDVCLMDLGQQPHLWPGLKGICKGLEARSNVVTKVFDEIAPQWNEWAKMLSLPTNQVFTAEELEEKSQEIARNKRESSVGTDKKHLRILAVDDDPVSLRLLVTLLKRDGHEVLMARDGKEALAIYLEHGVQMVITDWMMPEMDGLQLCSQIRKTKEGRKMYILLLTGRGEEERVVEAFSSGVDDYIVKPFEPELLRARIQPALRVISLQEDNDLQVRQKEILNRQLDVEKRKFKLAAMTDALTELPNRRAAMNRMEREWANSTRSGRPLSVIMIDVDHFKRVNDSWGHDVGDEVLRATAKAIYEVLRKGDTCARMGGEEFLVICPSTSTARGAIMVAERIREAVEKNVVKHGEFEGSVTISLGIGLRSEKIDSISGLLKAADQAVYDAKDGGRNRVEFCKPPEDNRKSA